MEKSSLELALDDARRRVSLLSGMVASAIEDRDYGRKMKMVVFSQQAAAKLKRYQKTLDETLALVRELESSTGELPLQGDVTQAARKGAK